MNIWRGKTNNFKSLYGRAMRHFDVRLCPIGAFGFYLLARFELTHEFSDEAARRLGDEAHDFTKNYTWFNYKLLVNSEPISITEKKTESLKNDAYAKAMKKILKECKISSNHLIHIGRTLGSVDLQIEEVDDEDVRQLGNWQTTVRDLAYSTKLPLKALRRAAAHEHCDGAFFCPRGKPKPDEELQRKIFPFVENAIESVNRAQQENEEQSANNLSTAAGFLECLKRLRTIILQDAAAIMILHPEREHHPLFSMDVFRGELFKVRSCVLVSASPV